MNPHLKYRTATSYGWTRIDMLIQVYDMAINAMKNGVEILNGTREGNILEARIDAQRKVLLIADGLAVEKGGTAVDVLNLCLFVFDKIPSDDVNDWNSALNILETLKEGFVSIQDEAREAERNGQIPALDAVAG